MIGPSLTKYIETVIPVREMESVMTIRVKIGEAKARLSELIAQVEAGEEVVIARGNQVVARIVRARATLDAKAAVERIRTRREALRAEGVTVTQDEIRQWRDGGRR